MTRDEIADLAIAADDRRRELHRTDACQMAPGVPWLWCTATDPDHWCGSCNEREASLTEFYAAEQALEAAIVAWRSERFEEAREGDPEVGPLSPLEEAHDADGGPGE
jgi:hypothetical protein